VFYNNSYTNRCTTVRHKRILSYGKSPTCFGLFRPFSGAIQRKKIQHWLIMLWMCNRWVQKRRLKLYKNLLKSTVKVACKCIIKCIIWMQTNIYRRMSPSCSGVCSCVLCVAASPWTGGARRHRDKSLKTKVTFCGKCLDSNYEFYDILRCSCHYYF
jgi:hypothetical protein